MKYPIKSERVRSGMSVREVSDALDVSQQTVRLWEQGRSKPSGESLVRLAHLYGCTPEYLLGMTDERKAAAKA